MNHDEMLLNDAYEHSERPYVDLGEKIHMHLIDGVAEYVGDEQECIQSFFHEDSQDTKGLHQVGYVYEAYYSTKNMTENLKYFVETKKARI